MDYSSQCQIILAWLREKGPINTKIARQICGCERLAARVSDLRRKGYPIRTEMKTYIKHDRLVRYAEYVLEDTKC